MSDIQDEAYSEAMDEIKKLNTEIERLKKRLDHRPFELSDDENVEPGFLAWWRGKDFSGYPWSRRETQLIALMAWRESVAEIERLKASFKTVNDLVNEMRKERKRHLDLLDCAADALEDPVWKERLHQPLIDKLREAAK